MRLCDLEQRPKKRGKDYTGQRFGHLTVLEFVGVNRTQGRSGIVRTHYYWKCRCDCGHICIVQQANLFAEKYKGRDVCCLRCFKKRHANPVLKLVKDFLAQTKP